MKPSNLSVAFGIRMVVPKRLARVVVCVLLLGGLSFGQRVPGQERSKRSTGRGGSVAPSDPNAPKGVYPTAHGIVKSISGSQLFVEVDEDH